MITVTAVILMPSILPLEIEETILDLLAEDDDEARSALKTCSLVCQAFLPICRKHIFASIVLSDKLGSPPSPGPNTHAFDRLLRETPKIADYIRKLNYYFGNADLLPNPSLQESLKRISRLEYLSVWQHDRFSYLNWRSIRPALLHLLHLPTLTHFDAASIIEFVVSDLIPCVNLKYLEIGAYTTVAAEDTFPATLPEHSIQLNEFVAQIRTSTATIKLCIARRPDGHPIIDFGSLSKLSVSFENLSEGVASQELFRRCHALTNVNVSFWDPGYVRPSLADMLRPSMQTLKHISVEIHVNDDHDDPLFDILSEFEDMRTKNVIETITIGISVHMRASCRRLGGDGWGALGLDEVLTTPGWFSLKRVSLAIDIDNMSTGNNRDELEVALRKLPETRFPRLLSSNSVSFDFELITIRAD